MHVFTDQLFLVLSSLFKDSMPWWEGREENNTEVGGRGKERGRDGREKERGGFRRVE